MEYPDLSFDCDITSDFIIIQSCLRDEKHNELVQNADNITLIDDHLTFNLGDSFDSFEELQARLQSHSTHSNVHYWMRDSRTVAGARMKTTRKIDSRLKYYSVKFACVYGGGFTKKGKGVRNTSTVRLDCPAHVLLRANRSGERLDVVSVCNHHNHDVSPDISRHMRQARKLTGQLREEVQDLLRMGVSKRRVQYFIEWRSGKQLTYKDVINMAAAIKGTTELPTENRQQFLMDILTKLEEEFSSQSDDAKKLCNKKRKYKTRIKKIKRAALLEEQTADMVPDPIDEVIVRNYVDAASDDNSNGQEFTDNIDNNNVMEYLLPLDYTELVINETKKGPDKVVLESDNLEVLLDGEAEDTDFVIENNEVFVSNEALPDDNDTNLVNPVTILHDDVIHFVNPEIVELDENNVFQLPNKESDNYFQYLDHIVIEDKDFVEDFENLGENVDKVHLIPPNEMHMLGDDEVILEESWVQENTLDNPIVNGVEVSIFEKCLNCERIKEDLNDEINVLKEEKRLLIEETERLKEKKEKLINDIENIKKKEHINREITNKPAAHTVRPFKIRNKIYLVKI